MAAKAGKPIRYAALLRGINVGGNKKIAMSDLRLLLSGLGHAEVSTLLQSGNAVFTAPPADAAGLAVQIEAALADQLGLTSRVLLRTHQQLAAVVDENPFPSAEDEPSKHLVQFLFRPLTKADRDKVTAFDAAGFAPEELRLGPEVIYFRFPDGIGRSKLGDAFAKYVVANFGKPADRPVMTGRNWNTVRKLCDLTAG